MKERKSIIKSEILNKPKSKREGIRQSYFFNLSLIRSFALSATLLVVRSFTISSTLSFFRSFALYITLSFILFACGNDKRQTAHIPDFPRPGDSSRTEGALRALTRSINRSAPASAYAKRAAILLAMGREKEALSDIDEAISRNDNAGSYYLTRSQILRALQQPDKALVNAQRAEILGVDTPELYTLQGDLLQQQNQFDKARLYVARALQMAPYDGEAY
ncbi:MAG TPA: hypothetical protein VK364_10015, partial [Hymenobacter sp.]|nr:hypothetical protein [Hymenobacter sp.]